ncbi:hypothetical protein AVEN_54197-1 [Araneus ventricosus]|uniref:Uncharacterized protein n=1 Tax=Araneus ventricosus TaxID=182803 RepID=A0A4Y2N2K9_ARAVE|nr:hypothetical protein AVEN_54197-1 [Araneus ventricosus]
MCNPSRFPFLNLSRYESCQSVRKRDVQSSNGSDSGLLLELEIERRNSKYDLERRGCCGSVFSCKSSGFLIILLSGGCKLKYGHETLLHRKLNNSTLSLQC